MSEQRTIEQRLAEALAVLQAIFEDDDNALEGDDWETAYRRVCQRAGAALSAAGVNALFSAKPTELGQAAIAKAEQPPITASDREWRQYDRDMRNAMLSSNQRLAGPFVVETVEDRGYLGASYRCWLASDPEKKICFEGNDRELEAYFQKVCAL